MNIIDLRSDTVTKPTQDMLAAMVQAELGDDVHGDDPTVNRLQERVAGLLGKEAALFVPSGTMANQIAIRAQTQPGDEVITEATAHVFYYETGAMAGLSGAQAFRLNGTRGLLEPEQIEAAIRPNDVHFPVSRLLVIENPHNHGGGTIYSLDRMDAIAKVAKKHELKMHLDGARLWNTCVALGVSPKECAKCFDTVSVCFSKGLGAPAGSVVAGSKAFIATAKRYRKMLGGAMRQAGILAAAGIYALDHHYERLKEDHDHAKWFARALSQIQNVEVEPEHVETNIVYFGVTDRSPQWLEAELKKRGVWVFAERSKEVRAVTHLDVNAADMAEAVKIIRQVVG